jgi:hypothetical protein
VSQLDAPVRLLRDVRVVGHHQNGVAGAVQFPEEGEHYFFICFVQVTRGLIGQDQFGLID